MNSEQFKIWLIEKKGLSQKGSSDVISRAKRAWLLAENHTIHEYSDFVELIGSGTNFYKVPPKSMSSIKRAVKLYFEFKTDFYVN